MEIVSGSVFVFLGLVAFGIAIMRRRSGAVIMVWLGLWSATYGLLRLAGPLVALARLPHPFQVAVSYLDAVNCLVVVVATRAWVELSAGKLRRVLWALIFVGLAIDAAGLGVFLFTGNSSSSAPYSNLLAVCTLSVLLTVVAVPKLSRKFLVTPNSGVLFIGTLVFTLEALYTNVWAYLGWQHAAIWDSLCFAVFLLSIGYVALQMVFASEHRLLSIEKELAIAREIQLSILPRVHPEVEHLGIAAAYRPMTEVAGTSMTSFPSIRTALEF